jgi:hypothetical protein
MTRYLACALAGALALPAAAQVYVPGDFPTLQSAIDGSPPGAVILASVNSGPIVIDKPITILGNPSWKVTVPCLSALPNAIELQGPGTGQVVLGGFSTELINCSPRGSAIAGGGFDELHLLDATMPALADIWLDGTTKGNDGIDVDVAVLLISGCTIEATGSDSALCYSAWGVLPHVDAAGVRAPGSQVLVLDSTIVGGETNDLCAMHLDCPTLPDPLLPGAGGPGVIAGALFVSNSEIRGGEGARPRSYAYGDPYSPLGVPLVCGQQPDGPDTVVDSYQPLRATLEGPARVAPGEVYVLQSTLSGIGSGAFLFASLGAAAPQLTTEGWIFLDPASLAFLGPAPIGSPS